MGWQRARTDEQKSERRDAICAAAFTLFRERGYENVSLNAVAAEAGFTKSNLYRYFSSKEEIFLNVFSHLFESWVEHCLLQLRKLQEGESIGRFAAAYVKSMKPHTRFLDLTPLLFTSLERNSSKEQLIRFKALSRELLNRIATEVCRIYPALNIQEAFKYLNLSFAATANYWAASTDNLVLEEVYRMEEFKDLRRDFERDLTAAIEITLRGLRPS